MITLILPFDKRCLSFAFKGQKVSYESFKEFVVVDMFFRQALSHFTKVEFRDKEQYSRYIRLITLFTESVIDNQDDELIDNGSFSYGMDVLSTLDQTDNEFEESNGYPQIPKDRKMFIELISENSSNQIDEDLYLKHFESTDLSKTNPNFSFDSNDATYKLNDTSAKDSKLLIKEQLHNGLNPNKSKLIDQLDSFGTIVKIERKSDISTTPKLHLQNNVTQPSTKKNNSLFVYIIVGGLWAVFLWNVFFKYLDTVSSTIAIIILSVAAISLGTNRSKT